MSNTIPDHSRQAVSEALEAALYCAAFQRLEEREMKKMLEEIRAGGEYAEATERTRRRLNRRRRLSMVKAALPRAVRAAAAVIALVSIGTGIALATSPAARQWAAGALQSRVTDPDGFFGEVRSSLTDGAALDGKLLVVEDHERISVYESTEAEPVTYEWRDAGDRTVEALAVDAGGAYMLYAEGMGARAFGFDHDYAPRSYGLGRVTLYDDGTFGVETLGTAPAAAILDPQGRRLNSYSVPGMVLAEGKLYFTAEYAVEEEQEGFSFAPANVRLFRWDVAEAAPTELDLGGVPLDWSPELFGGDGSVFLAAYDDGASQARLFRAEGDSLASMGSVPYSGTARPGSFALRLSDNALLYVLDGSVWLAPGMDAARATRVAGCGDIHGTALMLDGDTYAVVRGDSVSVFDLSAPMGEVDELVVDGDGVNTLVNQRFMAEHPDIAVVSDSARTMGDDTRYVDLMLSGRARGDVVALDHEDFPKARDAGLVAPLTDPALIAEWARMPEGLRNFLSVDGQPAAIPLDFYTYSDVFFLPENWEAVRGSFADYPDTWPEYIRWLAEYSHSALAGEYVIECDRVERIPLDAPRQFEMYTLWTLADAFARCWDALGEEIDFTRPEFTQCLDALAAVDWSALRYDDYAPEHRDMRALQFAFTYDPIFSENDWADGARTLRIREDAPRLSRASGSFCFMPAAGTRRASAQEYLKTLVAVNHTSGDGYLDARMGYDFTTAPEDLAKAVGDLCTADSIRRYRQQVGDVAFRAEPDRETLLAIRDAVVAYVAGRDSREELVDLLNQSYA